VAANISLSLDGRVSGPGGDYDMSWIVPHATTPGSRAHMLTVTRPATTVLLGRKNYQGFAGYWPAVADDTGADPADREFSRWLTGVEKIVFSATLERADWANTRITAASPAAAVKELRRQPGGDIIILASASIIRSLIEAGELDRLSITLCPELVGGGARLFHDGPAASSWTLTHTSRTESGALCLLYDRLRPGT
jgi:dihydrofolate reductase